MTSWKISLIIILIFLIVGGGFYFYQKNKNNYKKAGITSSPQISITISQTISTTSTPVSASTTKNTLAEPVADFRSRITKKPFGIYITPQNSPIQPEKFTGYHTGFDVEYADIVSDTPVYSVSDGTVEYAGIVSGYGGVIVVKENIDGKDILTLYGHLNPTTLISVGQKVSKNEQIGILGKDKSQETDGERKHLHFGIIKGGTIDFRGYVQNETELNAGWYNPLDFY